MIMKPMRLTEKHYQRGAATLHVLHLLEPNPSLSAEPAAIARLCEALADEVVSLCPDGPELPVGLRKLLEAKDCFVRAALY